MNLLKQISPEYRVDQNGMNLWNSLFDRPLLSETEWQVTPAVNIKEFDEKFIIELAAPGLDKKNFNIELEHNLLTISSELQDEKEEENVKVRKREFSYSSFRRSFKLPNTVNDQKIKGEYTNGILRIELPKNDEAKLKAKRSISIS